MMLNVTAVSPAEEWALILTFSNGERRGESGQTPFLLTS